ncbi:DNA alkylation repair protein [Halobacillus sp. B23F22_1]|uniref:DNA alkylation repair protein n=1 Tax=Halobacillus sp. B23F22_1 TaxID=3459514 RepID=UPI00373E32D8
MSRSHAIHESIVTAFQANRNEDQRFRMEQYMKNKFSFYGIKTPERKKIIKEVMALFPERSYAETVEVVELLYKEEERECHYAALTLLNSYRRSTPISSIGIYKELISQHSWWDTVDMISSQLCGNYFTSHSQYLHPLTIRWSRSSNLWVRRASLLFQLKSKEHTDEELLFQTIRELKHEKEFFIEKAIGWSLREYSKSCPTAVAAFIQNHEMRPLSRREGLKWIKKKGYEVSFNP